MPFSQRTTITVPAGGSVTVNNIHKRPLFLPDDETVQVGQEGGVCLSCNAPAECPICKDDECLRTWSVVIHGGNDPGEDPMFAANKSQVFSIGMEFDYDGYHLKGKQRLTGDARTQHMVFPGAPYSGQAGYSGTSVFRYSAYITLWIGDYKLITRERTSASTRRRGTYKYVTRYEGWGIHLGIIRDWLRGPACSTETCIPKNRGVQRCPWETAWSKPCLPIVNYSQWLYEAFRSPIGGVRTKGCFYDYGILPGGSPDGLGWVCDEWGGRQVALYGLNVGSDFIDSLSGKIDCDSLAGLKLPLIMTSKPAWTGVVRQKRIYSPDPEGRLTLADYPSDYEEWTGGAPEVTLYPAEKYRFRNAASTGVAVGASGTGVKS
jgi:hypothetical protein